MIIAVANSGARVCCTRRDIDARIARSRDMTVEWISNRRSGVKCILLTSELPPFAFDNIYDVHDANAKAQQVFHQDSFLPPGSSNLFVPSTWQTTQGTLLFCFPYAGGSPYIFRNWKTRLQPEVTVVALQAPGRGMRIAERPHHSVEQIVSEIVRSFPEMGGRPFALYGHSLGALIAFELVRRLRREDRPQPCHLFVGGARPPHIGPILPRLHHLEEQEFLKGLQARYSGLPSAILDNPEALALFLPALRADFAAYETHVYQSEPPLACPISGFAGERDTLVAAGTVAGWEMHTSSTFDLQVLRGSHFFLDESCDELTSIIKRELIAGC